MNTLRIRHVPRERDEELLGWVKRRASGESANAIARSVGVGSGNLIVATNDVRNADMAESGENVEGAYW